MNPIILTIISDAGCRLSVESVAGEIGIECLTVSFGEHLSDLVNRNNPFLLIVEFNSDNANWLQRHLSEIKSEHSDFPVIGITARDNEADFTRLERVGCTRILTPETFPQKAKSIIEKYLR